MHLLGKGHQVETGLVWELSVHPWRGRWSVRASALELVAVDCVQTAVSIVLR